MRLARTWPRSASRSALPDYADEVSSTDISAAVAAIDQANSADPNHLDGEPLALVQGRLAQGWIERLDANASDALLIAARAHHLRRWVVPRATYPEGRGGYLKWRRDQKSRHAEELRTLLIDVGVSVPTTERAAEIVQKLALGTDAEVQVFEDAVSLTFIETQFLATADKLADDQKMVDVVTKTLKKMSPAGHAAAATLTLDDRSADIVRRATAAL